MSTRDSVVNKVLVTCCCSSTACGTASCYNMWTAYEAMGLAQLNYQGCIWSLCAPICHQCTLGDTDQAGRRCSLCVRYCLYACALECVTPCDACYNCIFYNVDNCSDGVSGFKDMMKHVSWLGKKVEECLSLKTSNEPENTYNSFKP